VTASEAGAVEDTGSGTDLLDALIDGVHTGDNLVLQGDDDAAPVGLLVDRFVAAARGRVPLVVVNLAAPWDGPVPTGTRVLDLSPAATGQPSALPDAIGPDATLADALALIERADEEAGEGAAFVFDPLSAVPTHWGRDAALELFLATCPRLYRRRSLAVWPICASRHRPTFLRRLEEITQVVVELTSSPEGLRVGVRKADGRGADVAGRTVHAEVVGGDLVATAAPVTARQRLGRAIRDQRLGLGLSQSEVARRVGISPSALSQVERGVRGPSGDTLVRLWEVLEVPFGPTARRDHGYRVSRRSGRDRTRLQDGLDGERVLDGPDGTQTWLLRVAPGASGPRAPFAVKQVETVVVLRGILDLHLEGRTQTLHEGDGVELTRALVGGWANPGPTTTEVSWTLHGGGGTTG
jgi:transcriptional regulator with XRE-family HTH domain